MGAAAAAAQELRDMGVSLRILLAELEDEPLGVSWQEQEEISKVCNWAGFHEYTRDTAARVIPALCTVNEFLHRSECSKEEDMAVVGFEYFYAINPPGNEF